LETNQPLPPKQPKSLVQLARRISAWTTNCLLTVMLLVIALGFGREVLHWWHDEGTPPAVAPVDPLSDGAGLHVLEFGDQAWSIRRQEFSGRQGDVPAALQAACRTAIVDARPRGESPDAAEQELVNRLARERPVAERRGQWRIYLWGQGHPVLIGTRAVGPGTSADGTGRADHDHDHDHEYMVPDMVPDMVPAQPTSAGTNLDETTYRVVIWGVAVPAAADAWTLYLFQSGGTGGGQSQSEVAIPLPPGGHRLVAIRATQSTGCPGGEAITAFSADDGNLARGFYDRWFADHGWKVAAGWEQIGSGWHARFEMRRGSVGDRPHQVGDRPQQALAVDVRLGPDAQGRWTGLVMESGQ